MTFTTIYGELELFSSFLLIISPVSSSSFNFKCIHLYSLSIIGCLFNAGVLVSSLNMLFTCDNGRVLMGENLFPKNSPTSHGLVAFAFCSFFFRLRFFKKDGSFRMFFILMWAEGVLRIWVLFFLCFFLVSRKISSSAESVSSSQVGVKLLQSLLSLTTTSISLSSSMGVGIGKGMARGRSVVLGPRSGRSLSVQTGWAARGRADAEFVVLAEFV